MCEDSRIRISRSFATHYKNILTRFQTELSVHSTKVHQVKFSVSTCFVFKKVVVDIVVVDVMNLQ